MVIEYSNDKDVKVFQAFVNDPTNRKKLSKFTKTFGVTWIDEAIKLHSRLKSSANAHIYNTLYGGAKNSIETKEGTKKNHPKIFKVRFGEGPRKFFNHILNQEGDLLLTQNWDGNFNLIEMIYVIAVNNHKYDAV